MIDTSKNSKRKENNKARNKTRKNNYSNVIYKEGWVIISIKGEPFERGFQHGVLLKKDFAEIKKVFELCVELEFNVSFQEYLSIVDEKIKPVILNDYPEFYEELRGMSEGFGNISIDYLIAWNAYLSLGSYFKKSKQRCSAFIATGDATEKGDIIMAHNTHAEYFIGQIQNVIIYVYPTTGNSFVMQSAPGYIASGTDWFVCSTGIVGCETTISSIDYKPEFGSPYFCRIRQAMQYGKTLDEYADIMKHNNAGDYACSWLFGDINTNEIMLLEIGLQTSSIKRTNNGVFYGMNSSIDFNLRNTETTDNNIYDLNTSSGARNIRLNELLNNKYYGKINVSNTKKIMSDHYDVHLNKIVKNARSICKHSELNNEKGNAPFGNIDCKIVTTEMAQKLSFMAKYGSPCGTPFHAKEFLLKYPKYKKWKKVLKDLPVKRWIQVSAKN
jgi:hypothetical protein